MRLPPGDANLRRATAVILCCLALAACELALRWKDTTGQDRAQSEAAADVEICRVQTGADKLDGAPWPEDLAGRKARIILWGQVETCMGARGWVPDVRKWWTDTSGQNRTERQAELDVEDCSDQNHLTPTSGHDMSSEDFAAAVQGEMTCMATRGWKAKEKDDD